MISLDTTQTCDKYFAEWRQRIYTMTFTNFIFYTVHQNLVQENCWCLFLCMESHASRSSFIWCSSFHRYMNHKTCSFNFCSMPHSDKLWLKMHLTTSIFEMQLSVILVAAYLGKQNILDQHSMATEHTGKIIWHTWFFSMRKGFSFHIR